MVIKNAKFGVIWCHYTTPPYSVPINISVYW